MNKIVVERDSWGDPVIYVEDCKKYEYEEQNNLHNNKRR